MPSSPDLPNPKYGEHGTSPERKKPRLVNSPLDGRSAKPTELPLAPKSLHNT